MSAGSLLIRKWGTPSSRCCCPGPGVERVQKVSIIPRGVGALGYTIQRPTEDRFLLTEDELQNKIAVLLAGRAAERLIFGKVSTGAADDLAKASDIARSAATQYGMVPALGDVAYDRHPSQFLQGAHAPSWIERSYSEETAREIDCAVREIIARASDHATGLLRTRRDLLERGAAALLEKETLTVTDLQALLATPTAKPQLALAARSNYWGMARRHGRPNRTLSMLWATAVCGTRHSDAAPRGARPPIRRCRQPTGRLGARPRGPVIAPHAMIVVIGRNQQ